MPTNRRRFLQTAALISAASGTSAQTLAASPEADEVVILNDTHIGEKQGADHIHPQHLQQAVKAILALPRKPAAIIVNGDLAMSLGTPGDYAAFQKLIAPLREAGHMVHLTLGNHDERDEFFRAFPDEKSATNFKERRHNSLIDLPRVRLILLDTLKVAPAAPGLLGPEQIAWMLAQVDASPDKPVVIVAHHNPQAAGDPMHYPGGVEDTADFWPQLIERTQFKAWIHGHIHDWNLAMDHRAHVINTLACNMVANKALSTNGWTLARFSPTGIELNIHTHLTGHAWSGEKKWLFWRA